MSPSRARLLETLRAQTQPTTLEAISRLSGLHSNTVREHLDALIRAGLARRTSAPPSGRGRPAWLYASTEESGEAGETEYAGLAAALAQAIHHRSPAPIEDAIAAGRTWGRDLARQRDAAPQRSAVKARRQVVEMLDELGFAPETDDRAATVRLTRCPLLEAAHKYPEVVCGVHHGLARGALEEYGADPEGVSLQPFAEPGACRLQLLARAPKAAKKKP